MPGSSHLLIVDDSPTQLLQMRMLLEQDGFEVQSAKSGEEAYTAVMQDAPLVVITDLQMPGMSGLELVETLRGTHPSVPVILTTSDGSEEVAAEALRRGAASYVPKRIMSSTLAPVVRQVLSVGEAARSVQQLAKYTIETSVKLSLVSDESIVPNVIARLEQPLIELELFDEGQRMQVAMALDEALLNAMVHGNLEVSSDLRECDDGKGYQNLIQERKALAPYKDRCVFVELHATQSEVRFTIRDEGPGYDCSQVGDPTDPENLENASGRGLFMIHAFMDEVHNNAAGNEIILIKRKSSETADEDE